ncbi:hypothetical protein MGSAQ_001009 [marine sediment metagenome]|uniref:Uncharacterized protein n=1 Tax=marine sediment metagenome TaxID=412755 RepID=A0A1B6NVL7_9ZZZZ
MNNYCILLPKMRYAVSTRSLRNSTRKSVKYRHLLLYKY